MFYETYVLASRGKVDGPKGEKWTVPIVDSPSKVESGLTKSERSRGIPIPCCISHVKENNYGSLKLVLLISIIKIGNILKR